MSSPLANDIIAYLTLQGIVAGAGLDAFNGDLPEDVPDATYSAALVVDESTGRPPSIDYPNEETSFQVFIRSVDYPTGYALWKAVRNALHQNQTGTGDTYFGYPRFVDGDYDFYYFYIEAISEGGHIGKDEAGHECFSINFQTKTYQTTEVKHPPVESEAFEIAMAIAFS